jgi:hypothetical protein
VFSLKRSKLVAYTAQHLGKARVRPISHTQSLQDCNSSQCNGCGFIITLPVGCTRDRQQTRQDTRDALVVHIIDPSNRPFVIKDACEKISKSRLLGLKIVSILTHDDEEATTFIPADLTGAAEYEREGVHRGVLKLVETFHL